MHLLYRIRFHLSAFIKKMYWRYYKSKHNDAIVKIESTINTMPPEELAQMEIEIDSMLKELYKKHNNNEPELNPRRTMMFRSMRGEDKCNYITAPIYRQRIINTHQWAIARDINTFMADYTTAFGLLALETLIELRNSNEDFRIYALQGRPLHKRKSYRLVQETNLELISLCMQSDYDYHALSSQQLIHIADSAATVCSEVGIWAVKEKLSPDSQTAQDV